MHPATVAGKSRNHEHDFGALHGERPPPYNPNDHYGHQHNEYQQGHQHWGPVHQVPAPVVQPPTTVIITQPSPGVHQHYSVLRGLPHHSTTSTCANCNQVVSTRVVHRTSCKTHCWAFCLFMFLCWPCVCIPYCKDSCMTANHYCTRCDSFLGDSSNS
ncbi:lipopolysaccharide-induced tumor necrosis factor-alpha factor homolog [Cloeon dipterum]|uniref:lipopolysaccharide-induced tumor necrosis factor-alpha factor homolog n=1 Tax=Cloeon dipterum TaxID=197152 RepID=UPI0032203950